MIDTQRICKSILYQEMDDKNRSFWFDMKAKKFLHNIDTFYYSVKLKEDFTVESQDKTVLTFRYDIDRLNLRSKKKECTEKIVQLFVPEMNDYINLSTLKFSKYYNFSLEMPGEFNIFIAPIVPKNENEISLTCEIIVQIRSEMIWLYGVIQAFEKSYAWVKAICNIYNLHIKEVKENRTDFCWHSNYLSNPEKFFNIENMNEMRCTRLGQKTTYIFVDKGSNDSEFSYYSKGKKGQKVSLRIYNKSMEVIEKGDKSFFLKTWLFHNLINRYDFDIYEQAYLKRSWKYVTIARLNYYLEHGKDEQYCVECKQLVLQYEKSGRITDTMITLADKLTPPINIIINVEFQLMRKASKSYKLFSIKNNEDKKEVKRIYDFLDNRRLIADYLTDKTFRLVEKTGDSNKSRRPNCGFWTALRRTKLIDGSINTLSDLRMTRIYSK